MVRQSHNVKDIDENIENGLNCKWLEKKNSSDDFVCQITYRYEKQTSQDMQYVRAAMNMQYLRY